ncbi:class II aldolase/adducin family protein [Amedibacterium intestinale]|uniref:class II aldolase/adducin family protein n=1 Tax=Amedibacterium intestinale TaxID=2583452 RepID=UPI000E53CBC6|nr:class II aldolase/adducin family protein [Amedibacterium intestinale]RHO19461.1 class II aldolase/adducin family protein [Eubacterium sp. AM18-26]RHO22847.1 class II aldolase/adducin family protein [Eubacterium sp. AM18-10LB-B]RHO27544.1 class II aldolase/adducin family protein [Erysipelotrichaceae bacterium AM17-60]
MKVEVIKIAKMIFDRKLVNGSSGNISFKENDLIQISNSGSCFGLLENDSFSSIDINGNIENGTPSKEFPLHLSIYNISLKTKCIIHTHSFYSTLFTCLNNFENHVSFLFSYTPYLKIKTNSKIGCIQYYRPGSRELFEAFQKKVDEDIKVYFLGNHGIVVCEEDPYKAFCLLEEVEYSIKNYLEIYNPSFEDYHRIE